MTKIFISYSHADECWKDELVLHLKALQLNNGNFSFWHDRQISIGDDWYSKITSSISSAKIAILMISTDFLASNFIVKEEVQKFLYLQEKKGLIIMPFIIAPCSWKNIKWLQGIQAYGDDKDPLSKFQLKSFKSREILTEFTEKVDEKLKALKKEEENKQKTLIQEKQKKALMRQQARQFFFQKIKNILLIISKNSLSLILYSTRKITASTLKIFNFPSLKSFTKNLKFSINKLSSKIVSAAIVSSMLWIVFVREPPSPTNKLENNLSRHQNSDPTLLISKEPSQKLEMTYLKGGDFFIGCDLTICDRNNQVTLKDYLISKHEITFQQWDLCYEEKWCQHYPDDKSWGRHSRPVINVSWEDTKEFISWLNHKTGEQYRLPTEAEWEYAARKEAGVFAKYYWGDNINCGMANYNSCIGKTSPVGSYDYDKKQKLYDIAGNVYEWTQDCYHKNYVGIPNDGSSWEYNCDIADNRRVIRGGSWSSPQKELKSLSRNFAIKTKRTDIIGFRLVKTIQSP